MIIALIEEPTIDLLSKLWNNLIETISFKCREQRCFCKKVKIESVDKSIWYCFAGG